MQSLDDRSFVVAYDLGTSGVKAALVTTDGAVFATASEKYPLYIEQDGRAEQEQEDYWSAVCRCTHAAIAAGHADPANAIGMIFSAPWKGIIPVDRDGRSLHRASIWLDARAGDQARRMNEHFAGRLFFTDNEYWPRLMWFRENCPEMYAQTAVFHDVNSFLKWKATGRIGSDVSNNLTHSNDPALQALFDEILAFTGVDSEKFPRLVECHEEVGRTTPAAAAELGLVPGIPVFGGSGDIPAITVGSGCADIGSAHIYFGTSGWVGYTLPHTSDELYLSLFDSVRDIGLSAMNTMCMCLNWAVQRLYAAEYAQLGDGVYDLINRELEEIPAGCEGLLAAPWFYGERPPIGTETRAVYFGLGGQHDRRHMTRAVMEGLCFTLKMVSRRTEQEKGYAHPAEYTAVGGGARSPVWMQILANVLNAPVHVPRAAQHTGAVGAAYCALVGLGICRDFSEVRERLVMEHHYYPDPEAVKIYDAAFADFEKLFRLIKQFQEE